MSTDPKRPHADDKADPRDSYRQAIAAGVPRQRIQEFRLMAEYQHYPEVATLIEAGSSRRQVLLAIDKVRGRQAPPRPTCPACGQEVRRP